MYTMLRSRKRMRNADFAKRLFYAWGLYRLQAGEDLPQEWLGEQVSQRLGLEEPMSQSRVSKWLRGSVPRELETIQALADVLGVRAGWLAFGEGSAPNDPMADLMRPMLEP